MKTKNFIIGVLTGILLIILILFFNPYMLDSIAFYSSNPDLIFSSYEYNFSEEIIFSEKQLC